MDELLHHCLRELSFDGDFGCSVARLKDFIIDFYAQSSRPQNPDDAFCALVWSLVTRQSTVIVGIKPEGITEEVWIAPQQKTVRKAKAQGEQPAAPVLHLEFVPDANSRPLNELISHYGENLRIALKPDAIYAAITGTHIRFPKLSPMVYTALQIITRGRETGVTVIQLGKDSAYDQKTCFYLVKQLTDLDLVVKVRRGGVGSHFCIHKYFFERSSIWAAIRQEEEKAEEDNAMQQQPDLDIQEDENQPAACLDDLNFTSIDSRHLSSLSLVRSRVTRLLRASKNHIHVSSNMIKMIGFRNPTKTDRRFFQARMRELLAQGLVEHVLVPNVSRGQNIAISCFRLIPKQGSTDAQNVNVQVGTSASEGIDGLKDDDVEDEHPGVKMTATIHKQVSDLLECSGTSGMTLNEITAALLQFDKRTLELLLARAEKIHPPSHLRDLATVALMETSGRERRNRYYTLANYRELVTLEKLHDSVHSTVDLSSAGDFSSLGPALFYDDIKTLKAHQDGTKPSTQEKKATRARKYTNPIMPDGKVKQGRPRKQKYDEHGNVLVGKQPTKRKRDLADVGDTEPERPKKRGRPRKDPTVQVKEKPKRLVSKDPPTTGDEPPRKRARIRKPEEPEAPSVLPPPSDIPDVGTSVVEERPIDDVHFGTGTNHDPIIPVVQQNPPSPVLHSSNAPHDLNHPPPLPPDTSSMMQIDPQFLEHGTSTMSLDTSPRAAARQEIETFSPTTKPSALRKSRSKKDVLSKSRTNVSHLRRENEFLRVLEECGGIIAILSREMADAHASLLETLSAAGEGTSAPVGTKTDKRTVSACFNNLADRGKVSILKTLVASQTGATRPVVIAHLPDLDQHKISLYLNDIHKMSTTPQPSLPIARKLDESVEFSTGEKRQSRNALVSLLKSMGQGANKASREVDHDQPLTMDDSSIRNTFLADRTTYSQLYGYILGKALRGRQLHVSILRALEEKEPSSPFIVSLADRIIHISYFFSDITLGLYCSFVTPLSADDAFTTYFFDQDGRNVLLRNVPMNMLDLLQVGRARSKARMLDILSMLQSLGVVTPLQSSPPNEALITCSPFGDHPASYSLVTNDWAINNVTQTAPTYWRFNSSIPLYYWASRSEELPLLNVLSVESSTDAEDYWHHLQNACRLHDLNIVVPDASGITLAAPNLKIQRPLTRRQAWSSEYVLTWSQSQYLNQYVDLHTGNTPLQDEANGEERIEYIAWTVGATYEAIHHYMQRRHREVVHMIRIAEKQKTSHHQSKADELAKAALARKAEQARREKSEQWEELVRQVHPESYDTVAAFRLHPLRTQFMNHGAGNDFSRWESQISQVFEDARNAAKRVLRVKTSRPKVTAPFVPAPLLPQPTDIQPAYAPPLVANPPERDVRELIEAQGPPLPPPPKKKDRKQNKDAAVNTPTRRRKFLWDADYEELLRDAAVIIRSRCRSLARVDWGAFSQVFPSIPRNTTRQRLGMLRDEPGEEMYLDRLEDWWHNMWLKFRGTAFLPDRNPKSATTFDLVTHINFLRHHIDKNAIRTGLPQYEEQPAIILPASIHDLKESFSIVPLHPPVSSWDFMWLNSQEEAREKRSIEISTILVSENEKDFVAPSTEEEMLAEAAVKMTFGAPNSTYEPTIGSLVLNSIGDNLVKISTGNLLSRGVLSKQNRDPKKTLPGRQLRISDANLQAIGGSIPRELFADGASYEESLLDGELTEWPLQSTDGDVAALLDIISEEKVEFHINTSDLQDARLEIDWSSKRADDDDIETTIEMRYIGGERSDFLPEQSPIHEDGAHGEEDSGDATIHGRTETGQPACCSHASVDTFTLVDCVGCLNSEWRDITSSHCNIEICQKILSLVQSAGKKGIEKEILFDTIGGGKEQIWNALQKLTRPGQPLLCWVGYHSSIAISASFLSSWSVVVGDDPLRRVFPRRWLDIHGAIVPSVWEAALRAVMGVIVFRPGITQGELRWRLRSIYDRQELNDLMWYLLSRGRLRLENNAEIMEGVPFDNKEEREVSIHLSNKRWYQTQ